MSSRVNILYMVANKGISLNVIAYKREALRENNINIIKA